ncbi:DDE-type integrase/transposase/recombinase, partial [Klebsiella pneumoniae]|uniref:DDE-type integrase/transposase/recombinase n=1 Tax=Klebsiella pneumoniae TaxID=573 RepID=UPI00359D1912
PAYGPQNDVTLKMPAFEWVHVQLHQQKGMISLSPPTICNSAHRQIKYRNNVIECDHGKLKRIIGATLGFKSMKTAYATIKGIEVMRALRKGQASAFYYGDPLGEMRLVSRVFEM